MPFVCLEYTPRREVSQMHLVEQLSVESTAPVWDVFEDKELTGVEDSHYRSDLL